MAPAEETFPRDLNGGTKVEDDSPTGELRAVMRKPTGLLKLLFRFPVYLYRLGLGWLFGHRLLLLTHRGRSSGRKYRTVLEVMRFDPWTRECLVVSGFGHGADWYLNLRANPAVEIQLGLRRFAPVARFLTPEEGYAELTDYERRHPRATRFLLGLIGIGYDGSEEQRRWLAKSLPVVSFLPKESSSREPRAK